MSDSFFIAVVLPVLVTIALVSLAIIYLPTWAAVTALVIGVPIAIIAVLVAVMPHF